LPGDGDEASAREQPSLDQEQRERQREQDDREDRRASRVLLHADDREVDRHRQHFEVAAEKQRIAEVGEAFDEHDQERVGETRCQQRQRDGVE
jgi:hypothetical protein